MRWPRALILSLSKDFSTLECELLARRRFRSQAEARMAVFSYVFRYIEGFYNPLRRHSALGYRSPIAYEQAVPIQTSTETLLSQAP